VGLAVLVAAGLGVVALGIATANESVTYYLTPTEAVRSGSERDLRVGGLVADGSIEESRDGSSLVLSDGDTDMRVVFAGRLPDVIQEGQGAVVDGRWRMSGTFVGTAVVMQHSNEYRAPADEDD
jgi:cytochrome c-type biogenesis protein CcmE